MRKLTATFILLLMFCPSVMGAQSVFLTLVDADEVAVTFVAPASDGRIGAVGDEIVSNLGWGGGSQHYFSEYIPTADGEIKYGYYERDSSNENMTTAMVGLYSADGNTKLVEAINNNSATVCPTNADKFRFELAESYIVSTSLTYLCAKVSNDNDYIRGYTGDISGTMWRTTADWANAGNGGDTSTMHSTISKDSEQTTSGKLKIWFSNSDSDWGE